MATLSMKELQNIPSPAALFSSCKLKVVVSLMESESIHFIFSLPLFPLPSTFHSISMSNNTEPNIVLSECYLEVNGKAEVIHPIEGRMNKQGIKREALPFLLYLKTTLHDL